MSMYDSLPPEVKLITDEQEQVLKGETPFRTLVENLSSQFDEFKQSGYINMDTTNYFDEMANAISVSEQINRASLEEFEIDDGTLIRLKELFNEAVMSLMEKIDVDLYQVEQPFDMARILYTNFMLVDQRQPFYNFIINNTVRHAAMESEESIAYAQLKSNDPEPLYLISEKWMDRPLESILPFLRNYGMVDVCNWVDDGFMPEDVIYEVFLKPVKDHKVMFLGYYQNEIEV